jgi:hypothetical protein
MCSKTAPFQKKTNLNSNNKIDDSRQGQFNGDISEWDVSKVSAGAIDDVVIVSRIVSRIYLRLTISLLYKEVKASIQFPPSPPNNQNQPFSVGFLTLLRGKSGDIE